MEVSFEQFFITNWRFRFWLYEFFEWVNEFLRNTRLWRLSNPLIVRVVTSENDSSPKSIVIRFENTGKDRDWYNVLPNPSANDKSVIFEGISLYCVCVSIYRIVRPNWVLRMEGVNDLIYCSIVFPSTS